MGEYLTWLWATGIARAVLVLLLAPALCFAILGELARLCRSRRYGPEDGFWFGLRLGARILPWVLIPYSVLFVWALHPHLVMLFAGLCGFGDGVARPGRMVRRRWRRDARWLRRQVDPEIDHARDLTRDAARRTGQAAGRQARRAGKQAGRHAWRGLRGLGRSARSSARRAADTNPPTAAGWVFGRHHDNATPGDRARRDRWEARIAARLAAGPETDNGAGTRPTFDQRLADWADRLGLHRHDTP